MSLCLNPQCSKSKNSDNVLFCQTCGSELLLAGRYRVIKLLGGGGFGKTYEASDARSNFPKVLKVLISSLPKAVELFQREAEVLQLLNIPGIPKVEPDGYFVHFSRDSQQPIHCLVMEKIEGLDLCEYIRQRGDRPIDEKLAVQWLIEIVTILQQVHNQNFFHRDIKPSNIMLRADGRLVLIDFGTVRQVTETFWYAQAQGQITGIVSAGYTPPEQIYGQAVQQSDFFALGRTFVYLLTARDPRELYNAQTDKLNWHEVAPHISSSVTNLIDWLMDRLPSQRPSNTEVILQKLTEIDQSFSKPRQHSISTQSKNHLTSNHNPSFGTGRWLQWVFATGFGGWIIGLISVIFAFLSTTLDAALIGAIIAILQSWVLLPSLKYRVLWWVLATIAGQVISAKAFVWVANAIGYSLVSSLVGLVIYTAILGIAQGLVLRRYVGLRPIIWVLVTGVGIIFGAGVAYFTAIFAGRVLGLTMGFAVFAAITGMVLTKPLRGFAASA